MQEVWTIYEWRIQGKASRTEVDAKYENDAAARREMPLLLSVFLQPRERFGVDTLEWIDRFRFGRAVKKSRALNKKYSVVPVAVQTFGNTLALHFYCKNEEERGKLKSYYDALGWAITEFEEKDDPQWSYYENSLLPNDAQKQTIVNEEHIELMKRYGDDVLVPRPVNHHIAFADEVGRSGFVMEALKAGYALYGNSYFADVPLAHLCCLRVISTIDKPVMDEHTTKIVTMALSYGGKYHYWDCKSMGKRRAGPSRGGSGRLF